MSIKEAILSALAGVFGSLAIVLGVVFAFGRYDDAPKTVTTPVGMCPTDDSCAADYSHGQWTIKQVTP